MEFWLLIKSWNPSLSKSMYFILIIEFCFIGVNDMVVKFQSCFLFIISLFD